MKSVYQKFLFYLFFLVPLPLAYFTSRNIFAIPLVYVFWLLLIVSVFTVVIFQSQMFKADRYSVELVHDLREARMISFVVSYNENSDMLKETLVAVKKANKYGETWLLDDSTDPDTVKTMENVCRNLSIRFVHRDNRLGYKAGALNDALKMVDESYEFVSVFDSDQRPTPKFFNGVFGYFQKRDVAVVQLPQTYTAMSTSISVSAFFQQEVFLRKIMRARSNRSAFILGSGFVARISALREVGGFYDRIVTEDLATSIILQSRGWRIVYLDTADIWYGRPPETVSAYLKQQGRWSLGGFQSLSLLLSLSLPLGVFAEYMAGWLYWLWVGPIRLLSLLALVLFVDFHFATVIVNPYFFVIFYFPYFIYSMLFYYYTSSDGLMSYGARGFFMHQGAELLLIFTVTGSFLAALFRRKKPFAVTPKGVAGTYSFTQALPMIAIELTMASTFAIGLIWIREPIIESLKLAIGVNIFFALYLIPFLIAGSVILFTSTFIPKPDDLTKKLSDMPDKL